MKQREYITGVCVPLLKCLLCSYVITTGLLLILALLLYKLRLSESVVSIAVIVIYVAAAFLGGFLAGKCMQKRRFLWGMITGLLYFGILMMISCIYSGQLPVFGTGLLTTLILCSAGGTLGGMVS